MLGELFNWEEGVSTSGTNLVLPELVISWEVHTSLDHPLLLSRFFPQILGARFRLFYYVCDAGKLGHQIDPLYPKVFIIDIFSHCDRSRCRISPSSVRFFSVILSLTPKNIIRIKLRVRKQSWVAVVMYSLSCTPIMSHNRFIGLRKGGRQSACMQREESGITQAD